MVSEGKKGLEPSLRRRLAFAFGLIALLVLSCGVWATTTPIAGAVIASGIVVVESNVKKVQHPSGGIVAVIPVKNGDWVRAGNTVLKLDDTQARANLGIVTSQLIQLTGRKARLEAERDLADSIRFPADFLANDEAKAIAEGEKRLFAYRHAFKKGQIAQLTERIGQKKEEIKGLAAQRDAKQIETQLMVEELDRLEGLRKQELMTANRILSAQRDLTKLKGEWGALVAQVARAQGEISEMELQIIAQDQTMQTEATKELRAEVEARIAELMERKVAAEDQLKRVVLVAPQDGIVHDLAVHTVGGVISAGETVMTIVPNRDELSVEVRIATSDIDQVRLKQTAKLRFPALNQRTTPEIAGSVTSVGADLSRDAQTNSVFYVVRIRPDALHEDVKLVPGMPVEAFVATGERTALSYLVKPITDQFARAFRER